MKNLRRMGLLYLATATVVFVLSVKQTLSTVNRLLDALPYEDGAILWLDTAFNIDPTASADSITVWWKWLLLGGFHNLLTSLLAIPLLFCLWRYIHGGLEEIRITKNISGIEALRCLVRWLIVAYASSFVPLLLGLFLFHLLEFTQLNPVLRIATAASFGGVLYSGSWHIPKLLLKQAQNKAEWLVHKI